MKVVIIGGGSAGTTCAFELRKLNKDIDITIIEKTSNLEYSPCALPYVLSGEINSFKDIFIFKKQDYEQNNISLMLNSEVKNIDKNNKKIFVIQNKKTNKIKEITYDYLVLSMGSSCLIPQIKGIKNTDFQVLKTIDDAKKINKLIQKKKKSVIIGAGMIGVELAVSLANKGVKVTILEIKKQILSNILDQDMAQILEAYLKNKGIDIHINKKIKEISKNKILLNNSEILFDELFICSGVKPNLALAKNAGLNVNKGLVVNEFMKTSDKHIFACGDYVESYEFNTGKKILSHLGTNAVRQAKIIAKNIFAKKEKFPKVLNNTISKIGELHIGSVGLTKQQCEELEMKTIFAKHTSSLRAEYYPSKETITIKLVCDTKGTVLGGQIIGHNEVIGRLDLIALAIQKKIKVQELAELETCYNPACAPIFDPLTITAEICCKKLNMAVKKI